MNAFIRICPSCEQEVVYNRKDNCNRAIKLKKICRDCYKKELKEKCKGENNSFFGKKHTSETKEKLRQLSTGRIASKRTRQKQSEAHAGNKNAMFGRSNYDI